MKKYLLSLLFISCTICTMAQEYLYIDGHAIPVSDIKSIKSTWAEHPRSLSAVLQQDQNISLFVSALEATGWLDSLKCYEDRSYGFATDQDRIDSCTWSNDRLCIHVAAEYDNVAYPEKMMRTHTVFAEPNEIYADKYGIKTLADLSQLAKQLYDSVYPEDASVTDVTDTRNSLNRFVAYHILPFSGLYYKLTAIDGGKLVNNFNRRQADVTDWYETCMAYSSMKLSFPMGTQCGLYINRRGVQSRADDRGVFIGGARIATPEEMPVDANAINGLYHYIDDVIAYDQITQKVVFNDRIRLDCTTLSPDFMTLETDGEMARGHSSRNSANHYMYGAGGQASNAARNVDLAVGFKSGYVRNFEYDEYTHLHVRGRVLNYWSYAADEVILQGCYDAKIKLPPVPAGTYEVRLMTCTDFQSRGINAFFIDDIAVDVVDMRPGGRVTFGNTADLDLADEECIASFDRVARKNGWMKGPGDYSPGEKDSFGGSVMRDLTNTVRRVIGRFNTDGNSDHYLRIKQLVVSGGEIGFDFIELVPVSVCDNDYYLENRY